MNEVSTQDIVDEYISKILGLGFGMGTGDFDVPARADTILKILFINDDTVTIFAICHEYHHALSKHHGRLTAFNGNDSRNPNEHDCNYETIEELIRRYQTFDVSFNTITFMTWFGIPFEFESKVIEIYKSNYKLEVEETYYAQN